MLGWSSMRRMLTARLQNRSGVLNRFTGVLSRRQVNIEYLGRCNRGSKRFTDYIIIDGFMMRSSKSSSNSTVRSMWFAFAILQINHTWKRSYLGEGVCACWKACRNLGYYSTIPATVVWPKLDYDPDDGNAEKSEALASNPSLWN